MGVFSRRKKSPTVIAKDVEESTPALSPQPKALSASVLNSASPRDFYHPQQRISDASQFSQQYCPEPRTFDTFAENHEDHRDYQHPITSENNKSIAEPQHAVRQSHVEDAIQYKISSDLTNRHSRFNSLCKQPIEIDPYYTDHNVTDKYHDKSHLGGIHLHVKPSGRITMHAEASKQYSRSECCDSCYGDDSYRDNQFGHCDSCVDTSKMQDNIDIKQETFTCYDPNCRGGETSRRWTVKRNHSVPRQPSCPRNTSVCCDKHCSTNPQCCCQNGPALVQQINKCTPCGTTTTTTYHTPVCTTQTVVTGDGMIINNIKNNGISGPGLVPALNSQAYRIVGTTPVQQQTMPYLVSNRPLPVTYGGVPVVVPTSSGFQTQFLGGVAVQDNIRKIGF